MSDITVYCDFHTHKTEKLPYLALQSRTDCPEGKLVSLECHPWNLPDMIPANFSEILKRCAALGEIGLDRLNGADWQVQLDFFEKLVILGAELRKPVVVHCVRAVSEVKSILRDYPAPKLLHGFRGTVEKLDFWLDSGFVVSLHPRMWREKQLLNYLQQNNFFGIGIESDADFSFDIPETVSRIAVELEMPEIPELLHRNFEKFLNPAAF